MNATQPILDVGLVSLGACAITEPESGFPVGGSELQLWLLAARLARVEGARVTLYVCDLGQGERERDGVRVRPLVRVGRDLRLTAMNAWRILRRLAEARHRLYVTRSASGINGLVSLAARRAGGRHLHMCAHDDECAGLADATLSAAARWLHRTALRRADVLACQTEAQRRTLLRRFGRTAEIAPNLPPRRADAADTERSGALWVGRDVDWKQPEMFADLARRLPEHPFTMICQPQPGRDAARLARAEAPNLRFLPGLPYRQTERLFAAHRLFVNTSRAEGFPNTFLQAAAAGTPIVSLAVDPDGVIGRYGAGVVCGGDPNALVAAVGETLDREDLWRARSEGARRLYSAWEPAADAVVGLVRRAALADAQRGSAPCAG